MDPEKQARLEAAGFLAVKAEDFLGNHPGDWTKDRDHENGCYLNRCIECKTIFIGHKRRVICYLCANETTIQPS